MAVVTELSGVEAWVFSTLANDPTMQGLVGNPARVYSAIAPEGSAFPYVVMTYLAGADVIATGGGRVMSRPIYVVKGVDNASSFANLKAIATQIETLIGNQTGTTPDTRILSCVREQPFELIEVDQAGVVYRNLGGRYRIEAQSLN